MLEFGISCLIKKKKMRRVFCVQLRVTEVNLAVAPKVGLVV